MDFAIRLNGSASGRRAAPGPGWPSHSSATPTVAYARLGADVVRHTLIVVDFHHLLLAGVPAYSELMANAQGDTHH
ncbi:hypothetical protein FCJ59_28200 [Cupriavidus basilensis]|nr:hypothetical protein [Cupriavidus basilensis]